MAEQNGTFRRKKNNFTQVSNCILKDPDISLLARGLYSTIQMYITIPNFILHKSYLVKVCKEKEYAFDRAWKELKENGYLKVYRIPSGKRGSFEYEFDLLDEPDASTPNLINLSKKHRKTDSESEETPKNKESDHTPNLPPYGQTNICSDHHMVKQGNINNTDINNTDINNTENKSSSSPPPKTEVEKSFEKIEEEETTKDKKNEPSPPTGISSDELETVQHLIANNLKAKLTDLQVSKIIAAANGDIKLIESRINSAKNSRKKIIDIVAWLVAAVKSPDEDYEQVAFEPEIVEGQNKKPVKKNRIVNYKGRTWDYKRLEELEMQRLIAETEGRE